MAPRRPPRTQVTRRAIAGTTAGGWRDRITGVTPTVRSRTQRKGARRKQGCESGGVRLNETWVRRSVVFGFLLLCSALPICGEEFYVSPKGADTNSGTEARPFASLERARDAARAAKHDAPITIWLRGGDYRRTTAFALTSADSGTAAAPVVYRAVAGERVRIVGGVPVKDFKKWRGEILRADLRAQGITNYGHFVSRGMGRPNIAG